MFLMYSLIFYQQHTGVVVTDGNALSENTY